MILSNPAPNTASTLPMSTQRRSRRLPNPRITPASTIHISRTSDSLGQLIRAHAIIHIEGAKIVAVLDDPVRALTVAEIGFAADVGTVHWPGGALAVVVGFAFEGDVFGVEIVVLLW